MSIETAFVGFIVVLLGVAGVVVQAIGRAATASADRAKATAEAASKREEIFNGMVTDLRAEIATVKVEYREEVKRGNDQEIKIRELLEKLAELPKLERDIEKLRAEVANLVTELNQVKEARIQREKELETERQAREAAEGRVSDMQNAFIKERGEWQTERGKLNARITELTRQVEQHDARIGSVEQDIRQTPKQEIPAVSGDMPLASGQ